MKRRNFLFTGVLSAVLSVVAVSCASPNAGTEGGQKLVMATSADYPPYEFVDSSSGNQEIVGFDVEIAKAITEELGYDLEIQNIDFNGLIPALQSKRADFVMAGMTPTEERKQNVDFSEIYYDAKNTIVTVKDSGLTTAESLNGKTVGAQLGSIQEGAAKEIQGANVKPLNRTTEMIQELKAGRVDALIMEDTVAEGYVDNNPDLEFNEIPTEGESGSAIAFPKDSELTPEFNRVLAEMESSGKIEELINKWFGENSPASQAGEASS